MELDLKKLAYLLYGLVASLPSPSSNIEAWIIIIPTKYSGTTLSKEKSLGTTLRSTNFVLHFRSFSGQFWGIVESLLEHWSALGRYQARISLNSL